MKRYLVILLTVLIFAAWIDPFKDAVESGNSSYEKNDSKKALEYYKEAEKHAPDGKRKAMLDFNSGDAHYKLENYDIAADKFKSSIASENPDLQKKAFFNMGNAYFKQKKYKEAADSYVKALEIDPDYEKAKKNLEYLLKDQKNKDQKENDKDKSGGQGNSKDKKENDSKNNEKKMSDIQARNLLESMKNKPVRKQKGKGDGTKYLEKYW